MQEKAAPACKAETFCEISKILRRAFLHLSFAKDNVGESFSKVNLQKIFREIIEQFKKSNYQITNVRKNNKYSVFDIKTDHLDEKNKTIEKFFNIVRYSKNLLFTFPKFIQIFKSGSNIDSEI